MKHTREERKGLNIEASAHKELKKYCYRHGFAMQVFVSNIIREYLCTKGKE